MCGKGIHYGASVTNTSETLNSGPTSATPAKKSWDAMTHFVTSSLVLISATLVLHEPAVTCTRRKAFIGGSGGSGGGEIL